MRLISAVSGVRIPAPPHKSTNLPLRGGNRRVIMKKIITLATAGIFLLSLQGARAQKEVEAPAVPPMLQGQKPLAAPETKEPAAPQPGQAEKAKPKGKAHTASKSQKGTTSKRTTHKKTASDKSRTSARAHKAAKTKGSKAAAKTNLPAAEPAAPPAVEPAAPAAPPCPNTGPPKTEPGN